MKVISGVLATISWLCPHHDAEPYGAAGSRSAFILIAWIS